MKTALSVADVPLPLQAASMLEEFRVFGSSGTGFLRAAHCNADSNMNEIVPKD